MSDRAFGVTITALAIMGICFGGATVTYVAVQHAKLVYAEARQ